MGIRFETGRSGHRDAIRDMFNEFWRPDYVAMRPAFYDWQFHRNPYIPYDFEDSVILAFDNDRIVGFLGLVPTIFHVGNSLVRGTWLSNWLSHPDYRNRGIGVFLLKKAMERFPIVASTALSRFAQPIYTGLQFKYLELMYRLLLIFDPEQTSALMETPRPEDVRKLEELAARVPVGDLATSGFEPADAFPEDIGDFTARMVREGSLMPVRDFQYLTWRYAEHPNLSYRIFIERPNGEIEGLAVARIETVRDRPEKVGRLLEWFASEKGLPGLASRVLGFFRSEGCAFADFFCTSTTFTADLRKLGFAPESEFPDIVVPYLFQPLDHRRRGTNFVAWNSLEDEAGEIASDLQRWFVTKGDNDQDRPN